MLPDPHNLDPATLPLSQIPARLAQLAAEQATLAARLLQAPPAAVPARGIEDCADDLLKTEGAAALLHCSTKFLYRHQRELGAIRRGRGLLWSRRAVERWLARHKA